MALGDFIHEFDRRSDPALESDVIVNSPAELPAPEGGVINLVDFKHYKIGAGFSISDRIVVGKDNLWTSGSQFANTVTYTGTDTMFTGVDKTFHMVQSRISAPNAVQVFDFSDSAVLNTHIFASDTFTIKDCNKIGTFADMFSVIFGFGLFDDAGDGVTIEGVLSNLVNIQDITATSTSPTFIAVDFGTGLLGNVNISDVKIIAPVTGAIGLKGLAASANMVTGAIANVTRCSFVNTDIPISGVSLSDIQWEFQANSGLDSSSKSVVSNLSSAQTVTVGGGNQNVWINIGGTNWVTATVERFTTNNAGLVTYTGIPTIKGRPCITATIEKSGGGSDELDLGISVNGADPVSSSISSTENNAPTSVTSKDLLDIATGDTFQAMTRNVDGTSNIIVSRANLDVINGF